MNTFKQNRKSILSIATTCCLTLLLLNCSSDDTTSDEVEETEEGTSVVVAVDGSLFITDEGNVSVTTVPCTLTDDTETDL